MIICPEPHYPITNHSKTNRFNSYYEISCACGTLLSELNWPMASCNALFQAHMRDVRYQKNKNIGHKK